MFGADSTLSSRMIANGLLTFSCVTRPNRRAPAVLKLIETTGWPSWSNVCFASTSWSPETITRRLTAMPPLPSAIGSTWLPAGARPCCDLGRIGGEVDELELEAGRLADQPLERFGVLDARHLDQDPVGALVDDRDFLGALRIDAAADDVAGDGHRVAQRALRTARRRGQDDPGRIDRPGRPSRASRSGRPAGSSLASRSTRGIDLRRVADEEGHAPAASKCRRSRRAGARRSSVATWSSIACRRCLAASTWSASSSSWLPPARSRPRLIVALGSHLG